MEVQVGDTKQTHKLKAIERGQMGLFHRYCVLVSNRPAVTSATDKEAPDTAAETLPPATAPAAVPTETANRMKTMELAVVGEAPPQPETPTLPYCERTAMMSLCVVQLARCRIPTAVPHHAGKCHSTRHDDIARA